MTEQTKPRNTKNVTTRSNQKITEPNLIYPIGLEGSFLNNHILVKSHLRPETIGKSDVRQNITNSIC